MLLLLLSKQMSITYIVVHLTSQDLCFLIYCNEVSADAIYDYDYKDNNNYYYCCFCCYCCCCYHLSKCQSLLKCHCIDITSMQPYLPTVKLLVILLTLKLLAHIDIKNKQKTVSNLCWQVVLWHKVVHSKWWFIIVAQLCLQRIWG